MNEKNQTFPDAVQASLLILALFAIEYLVRALLHDMNGLMPIDRQNITAGVVVLANGCVFTFLVHHKGLTYRALMHSSRVSAGAMFALLLLPILLILPALTLISSFLMQLLVWIFPMSSWEQAWFGQIFSGSPGMVVLVCIVGPILEEMLFRGVILRSFLQQYSRRRAIVGSAVLFGLAHLNIYQFVTATLGGILLGWLYERTRSLIPCMTLHCVYNSSCLFFAIAFSKNPIGYEMKLPVWLPLAAVSCGVGTHLLRRLLLHSSASR